MPTFSTLRTRLRNDVLAESDTSFFSDADLLTFLSEASVEIASMGGFPTATSASSVSSGATTVTAPTDISNIEFQEVTFDNYTLDKVDGRTVKLYQGIGGQTRYYDYDARAGGSIHLAPAAHTSGTLTVSYVDDLSGDSYSASDTPWNGELADWHDAIVYAAGVKAFERSGEYDRAEYWGARLQRRLEPLAIYLDNKNVLNVMIRREPERERG